MANVIWKTFSVVPALICQIVFVGLPAAYLESLVSRRVPVLGLRKALVALITIVAIRTFLDLLRDSASVTERN
jgi:hypothetical protein